MLYYITLIYCLLLQLKPWGVRGASHQPAVMSDHRTISLMFYSPIYPVEEGNEDVGLIQFGVNKLSSLGQKTRREWRISCVLYCLQSLSWVRLKYQEGVLHELDIRLVLQQNSRSFNVSVAWWPARENATAEILFRTVGGQNANTLFIVNPVLLSLIW